MNESWENIRARIIDRDRACSGRFLGGPCSPLIDVHHIVPRDEGGTDEDENLLALCHRHHPMLESMRRQILRRRGWKTCPHDHRYSWAREECEAKLNRAA
jgi:hypothetical protein